METKYLGYRFSSVKITASCLWIWFAGIHLWIQQTKHYQCKSGFVPKYFQRAQMVHMYFSYLPVKQI
jgi:hypothetical protein